MPRGHVDGGGGGKITISECRPPFRMPAERARRTEMDSACTNEKIRNADAVALEKRSGGSSAKSSKIERN